MALRAVPRDNPSATAERETGEDALGADPNTVPTDISSQAEEHGPQGAVRVDCVEQRSSRPGGSEASGRDRSQLALRAVRRDPTSAIAEREREADARRADPKSIQTDSTDTEDDADNSQLATQGPIPQELCSTESGADADASTISTGVVAEANVPIPKCLSGRRHFNDWWVKLQECYQNKNCPLTAYEQGEILAMLARSPFSAVEKLQYSVINFETSYAALLKKQHPARSAATTAAGNTS